MEHPAGAEPRHRHRARFYLSRALVFEGWESWDFGKCRTSKPLGSAMQEEVHQRGNHQQCQQEAKDSPAAAGLRSDWGAVVGGHKASTVRVLGLNRAGWLEVLRVTER